MIDLYTAATPDVRLPVIISRGMKLPPYRNDARLIRSTQALLIR